RLPAAHPFVHRLLHPHTHIKPAVRVVTSELPIAYPHTNLTSASLPHTFPVHAKLESSRDETRESLQLSRRGRAFSGLVGALVWFKSRGGTRLVETGKKTRWGLLWGKGVDQGLYEPRYIYLEAIPRFLPIHCFSTAVPSSRYTGRCCLSVGTFKRYLHAQS